MLDLATSTLASTARVWRGTMAAAESTQPDQLLELYEFEACPFCRIVRETLTELDIDVLIRPCPKGGTRFRPQAEALGGKAQFPLLSDPNTDEVLYESAAIVAHLRHHYGRRTAKTHMGGSLAFGGSVAASALRRMRGLRCAASTAPDQPLELYSFESSPYSRLVRETLCELEIPYILRNMGKARTEDMGPPWVRRLFFTDRPVDGRNRKRMMAETGRLQVPYLIDPNTGTRMYESGEINDYLRRTYGSSN